MKGTTGIRSRQDRAKKMLDEQIKRGTKPEKVNNKTTSKMVSLTQGDIARIKKEIDILNNPKKKKE